MHVLCVVKLMLSCKTGIHEFGVGSPLILISYFFMVTEIYGAIIIHNFLQEEIANIPFKFIVN